jgi:hypothetical protein
VLVQAVQDVYGFGTAVLQQEQQQQQSKPIKHDRSVAVLVQAVQDVDGSSAAVLQAAAAQLNQRTRHSGDTSAGAGSAAC